MTEEQEIGAAVAAVVSEELNILAGDLNPDTNLRELQGVESIKVLRIVTKLERKYGVELEDETVFRVKTIRELADAIAMLRQRVA